MITKYFLAFLTITHSILVFAEESNCISCHTVQGADWTISHHAHAMAEAIDQNVLGDFNNATITRVNTTAKFYIQSGKYKVVLEQAGERSDFDIKYTFGFKPLQQYLIETSNGHLQVFPFAWDSREKQVGGQRWYHIYDENVLSTSRIHWQQPLQNWNGMCADCHSSGLIRNYDLDTNSFQSTYTDVNVGCASCHVIEDNHAKSVDQQQVLNQPKKSRPTRQWQFSAESNFAQLIGNNNNVEDMYKCFACHSLREPLTDGINPEHQYLDQFVPTFISPTQYHADGQIKEEVYVYGSFLQSKMFQAGVQCSDCHDSHSNTLKVEGNGLCLQCHKANVYQTNAHLRHDLDTDAAQCVSCHMPSETYMGVDNRRDHKFVIPRPALSEKYDIPNACADCHATKGNKWASDVIEKWYKPEYPIAPAELFFIELMHRGSLPYSKHIALINSVDISPIKRASALAMLPNSTDFIEYEFAETWVKSEQPLIRLALAKIGYLFSKLDREALLIPLLADEYRAIRTTAVEHLIPTINSTEIFKTALKELEQKYAINAWRGEGTLNKSMHHLKMGETEHAISLLKKSIKIDPFFAPSYVNLVDIYRQSGKAHLEKEILELGTSRIKDSAILEYSYGLHLVRNQNYGDAKRHFLKATEIDVSDPDFALAYLLILEALNQRDEANAWIRDNNQRFKNSRNIQAVVKRVQN